MNEDHNEINQLPHTKNSNKPWSFFFAYSLRTLRDIFFYVSVNNPTPRELYAAMDRNEIKAPKERWANTTSKDKDRLKLEYLHGAKFLELIIEIDGRLQIDYEKFGEEKIAILSQDIGRVVDKGGSLPLSDIEISAFTPIILNYSRAKEFLLWFLDFAQFPSIDKFSVESFRENAKAIYIDRGKAQKAAELVFREVDQKLWKIPFDEYLRDAEKKRTNDYTRSVTYVFPAWFQELKLINRIPVLKEFGFFDGHWELNYPLSDKKIDVEEFERFLLANFQHNRSAITVIWIPEIIYRAALEFHLAVDKIKDLVIALYETKKPRYIMERSSLQVMRYSNNLRARNRHQELFINYKDFNRNNLIINN
jgi:hypothetical protein